MDEAGFETFYRRVAGGLWSYLYRLTGDAAASDDLLQMAFVRFVRSQPVLEGEEQMRRWIFRTATNLAMDHFRETRRRRDRDQAFAGRTSRHEDSPELKHDMMRTFSELQPRERALLWLAHVEEAAHDDIGQALGVKAKSVKVLLFRARRKLADLLTKKGLGR